MHAGRALPSRASPQPTVSSMNFSRLIPGAPPMLASCCRFAFDVKTVGAAPAILYIAPPGTPVEVVLGYPVGLHA